LQIIEFPGASYGEFWPDRDRIQLAEPSTGGSRDPSLPCEPRRQVVGQGHNDGLVWYFDGQRWLSLGPCVGVSACAFHPTSGEIYASNPDGVSGLYQTEGSWTRPYQDTLGRREYGGSSLTDPSSREMRLTPRNLYQSLRTLLVSELVKGTKEDSSLSLMDEPGRLSLEFISSSGQIASVTISLSIPQTSNEDYSF
jgi:hypothetical protein